MVKETITKPDGRYLIYYTFTDDEGPEPPARHPEPVEG
jgi:hypothetical protein